ncbi:methyltransferase small domain-containing protein [Brachyspira hampsonii 30446]|uniref:Methyltransferase small domain-containing protein n=1 Tax=Brachyspira hampsonii 30446 TaxID=1289135 RepID=A0A2U4EW33_9SPIR|nr:methyltransferase [Brachyspira hampsonii]EKV57176.1 methyltransferase small domain-containing protein [Brachyspira hampsonii 30446]MBW5394303.1 methyltransferase domain-containing protein [Brachyspira hampsonii]OEJ19912.1 methyltransferase [Brachyspira hampsonii]
MYNIEITIKNIDLKFISNDKLFSPKNIDIGTLSMIDEVNFENENKILDLGCGYGVVGILAAKIIGDNKAVMCDIDSEAVEASKNNAVLNNVSNISIVQSDGLKNIIDKDFSMILSNPPYHTDFSVAKHFIESGFYKLALNGKFIMVTKRLDWYRNKLSSVFGGVKVKEKNGYYIFISEKRNMLDSNKLKKRLKKENRDTLKSMTSNKKNYK